MMTLMVRANPYVNVLRPRSRTKSCNPFLVETNNEDVREQGFAFLLKTTKRIKTSSNRRRGSSNSSISSSISISRSISRCRSSSSRRSSGMLNLFSNKKKIAIIKKRRGDVKKIGVFERANNNNNNNNNGGSSNTSSTNTTRLGRAMSAIFKSASKRVKRNFNRIPIALIALLVGVSLTAFIPHPESPGDAFITFTIVTLGEFMSSILYSAKNQGGFLRWAKYGETVPILLNAFKIGVFYGLFIDSFKVGS